MLHRQVLDMLYNVFILLMCVFLDCHFFPLCLCVSSSIVIFFAMLMYFFLYCTCFRYASFSSSLCICVSSYVVICSLFLCISLSIIIFFRYAYACLLQLLYFFLMLNATLCVFLDCNMFILSYSRCHVFPRTDLQYYTQHTRVISCS